MNKIIDVLIDGDLVAVAYEHLDHYKDTNLDIDDFIREYEIDVEDDELYTLELDYMSDLVEWATKSLTKSNTNHE